MFNLFGRDKAATKEAPEPAQPPAPEASQETSSLLARFKKSVSKTRSEIAARVEGFFGAQALDPEQLQHLENALLAADLGVTTTKELLDRVRDRSTQEPLRDPAALRAALKAHLLEILYNVPLRNGAGSPARPYVILMVGVNGTGKTTTIGKLAHRFRGEGLSVMLCAGDTFRAAASEQLAIWAERTGAQLITQKPGTDPTAVLFEGLSAAKSRGIDVVMVDTAGRLQNKSNLMAELEKMKRTATRLVPGAPHEVLLVIDATTGQNGLAQAREFFSVAGVTGVVLTKLDGTAHGGIVVPIVRELGLPVRFAGTGETADDLVPFDPQIFVDSLFD